MHLKSTYITQNPKYLTFIQHFLNSTFISTLGPHYLDHCAIYKLGYQKQQNSHIFNLLASKPEIPYLYRQNAPLAAKSSKLQPLYMWKPFGLIHPLERRKEEKGFEIYTRISWFLIWLKPFKWVYSKRWMVVNYNTNLLSYIIFRYHTCTYENTSDILTNEKERIYYER